MHPSGVGGRHIHGSKPILPIAAGVVSDAESQMTEDGLASGIPRVRGRAGRKPDITLEIRKGNICQPKRITTKIVVGVSLVPNHKLVVRCPVQGDFQGTGTRIVAGVAGGIPLTPKVVVGYECVAKPVPPDIADLAA